jgi:hypothetical protein
VATSYEAAATALPRFRMRMLWTSAARATSEPSVVAIVPIRPLKLTLAATDVLSDTVFSWLLDAAKAEGT